MDRTRCTVRKLCIMALWAILSPLAGAETVEDDIRFETYGQALFGKDQGGGAAVKIIPLVNQPVFSQIEGPVRRGGIYTIPQEIPLSTAQSIWQQAVNACTTKRSQTKKVTIDLGGLVGKVSRSCYGSVTPTTSQCVNGGTISPKLSATCCSLGGTAPGSCTLGSTVSKTVTYTFNVGPGIGPKPTTPPSRDYDVGLEVVASAAIEVGIDGTLELDAGSVDVEYPTTVVLSTGASSVPKGVQFEVLARHAPGDVYMETEYPNINLKLGAYTDVDATVHIDYAAVDYATGDQLRSTLSVDAFNTGDNAQADSQGRLIHEIIDVKAGLGAGLQVGVNTDIAAGGPEGSTIDPGDTFLLPFKFPYNITAPPSPVAFCGILPRPECNTNPPATFDLVEMTFQLPILDTPALPGFNGGYSGGIKDAFGNPVPLPQKRNHLEADGTVVNTTLTGSRDALQSSLEALGGDLSKLSIDDGILHTDLFRIDFDIDGLGGFPGGSNVSFGHIPEGVPVIGGGPLIDASANLYDIDIALYESFDQTLSFTPNLVVELVFSKPVFVRDPLIHAGFVQVGLNDQGEYSYTLPIDAKGNNKLIVIQPAGGVTITPRYSIANNLFTNQLDLLLNAGLQGTIGQMSIGGAIWTLVGGLITGGTALDSWNFAIAEIAPSFNKPLRIPGRDVFPLEGFGDPVSGTPITVSEAGPDSDGDGMPDDFESRWGFNPAVDDASGDDDRDGLDNLGEYLLGSRPDRADTDGDLLPDGWEAMRDLNPVDPGDAALDRDGNGLSNLAEYLSTFLNPGNAHIGHLVLAERILSGEIEGSPEDAALLDLNRNELIDPGDVMILRTWLTGTVIPR